MPDMSRLFGRSMPFPSSPVHDNLFHRKAGVQLDFIVVGGSIGGLSAAYNLKQAGHNVRVLERGSGSQNALGGLRVPPNMTKLLQHWGLGKRVRQLSVKCPRIDFLDCKSGEWLSSLVYHKELMKELQADLYGMHYADLHQMIHELVVDSGVQIDYNCNVVDVDVSEPSVLLESGERLKADIVVGADGPHSLVREKLVGRKEEPKVGPYTAYTYMVPVKAMKDDPKLRPLTEDGTWSLWMGTKRCVLTYLVRPDEYSVQIIETNLNAASGWDTQVPLSKLDLSEFEERVHRLLALKTHAVETAHLLQDWLEDWFDEDGHVVLLGDAVHILNPSTSHGAALAMEDGAVLGSLFSRLQTRDPEEIYRLLSAYQEIRQERCKVTLESEAQKVAFSVLEEGDPIRTARDEGFRKAREQQSLDWDDVGEDYLRGAWDELKESFGYEAYDAADDWWVDWGLLRERMNVATSMNGSLPTSMNLLSGLSAHVVVSSSAEH